MREFLGIGGTKNVRVLEKIFLNPAGISKNIFPSLPQARLTPPSYYILKLKRRENEKEKKYCQARMLDCGASVLFPT